MFWPEGNKSGDQVWTASDLEVYTHIIYISVPAGTIAERRQKDTTRSRTPTSAEHLQRWQDIEQNMLKALCRESGIAFSVLASTSNLVVDCAQQLCNFRLHTEIHNLKHAEDRLDEIFGPNREKLETVLVVDGDKTLTSMDTGAMFWEKVGKANNLKWAIDSSDPLKTLFGGPLGYSYAAFHQASLLYEALPKDDFDVVCDKVASEVVMYSDFVSLLQLVSEQEHVGVVIVSCGIRRVWEQVLARENLSAVKVVAAGRLEDYLVVTASVKAALVDRLRKNYDTHVWAFGDSPLDLEMLSRADEAIVIVGKSRVETLLMSAIEHKNLRARQAVLPSTASPRLNTTRMPLVQLTSQSFIESILRCRKSNVYTELSVLQATDRTAAKLLMTPMRNANISGHILREAHHRVGYYLATEFLGNVLGIEEYLVPHVQGHTTSGFRVLHEHQTLIVALMRGGEPMAFGVSEALPLATFLHAKDPEDIKATHVEGQLNIVLVDSVVNSGKTIVEFCRAYPEAARNDPYRCGSRSGNFSIVALRLSENKFTGKGTTDTGNRLFNTTYLP
ncbi:uracil phosphoribosyltransferase [Botrytis cinerea]